MLKHKTLIYVLIIVLVVLVTSVVYFEITKVTSIGSYSTYELKSLHGLWGGYNINIKSNGDIYVEYKELGKPLETFQDRLSNEDMHDFIQVFVDNKFRKIKEVKTKGVPDESIAFIIVTDPTGKSTRVSQLFNERTENFKVIYDEFIKIGEFVIAKKQKKSSNVAG